MIAKTTVGYQSPTEALPSNVASIAGIYPFRRLSLAITAEEIPRLSPAQSISLVLDLGTLRFSVIRGSSCSGCAEIALAGTCKESQPHFTDQSRTQRTFHRRLVVAMLDGATISGCLLRRLAGEDA